MRISLMGCGVVFAAAFSMTALSFGQDGAPMQRPGGPPLVPPIEYAKGRVGDWITAGPAKYRVVSVESGLRDYKQKYNQMGRVIHPGFSSDRLAVIQIEITNTTNHPILPPLFIAALTDSDGIRGTDWSLDARRQPFLEGSYREERGGSGPAEIGAGQVAKVAVVFSISPKALPKSIEFAPENFSDMPFERGAPPPPDSSATPADGRMGPRPRRPGRRPREMVHVLVDLTPPMKH